MIIIMGVSGSGKTEIVKSMLRKSPELRKVVTFTTRKPREGEKDGEDYFFVSEEEFLNLAKKNFFAEYNTYCGCYYGTPVSECRKHDRSVAILTPAGFRELSARNDLFKPGDIHSVFIYIDYNAQIANLTSRGTESGEHIASRINIDTGMFNGVFKEASETIYNIGNKYTPDQIADRILEIEAMRKKGVEEHV